MSRPIIRNRIKEVIDDDKCLEQIKDIFNIYAFKVYQNFSQEDVIRDILHHFDTFAIIPTGGGKSICFQAPALFMDGITIVITPLVELIRDQVNQFNEIIEDYNNKRRDIGLRPYKAVYPGMDGLSPDDIFNSVVSDSTDDSEPIYCLLYLSPEKFTNPKFMRIFARYAECNLKIGNIVIDEVHCLSLWGFDFREDYVNIMNFIKQFPVRPAINAFTATVTTVDIKIIEHLLGFDKSNKANRYRFFQCLKPREELRFMPIIRCCNDSEEESSDHPRRTSALISILEQYNNVNMIIYCTTVKGTIELYDFLRTGANLNGRKLYMYHGSMSKTTRSANAAKFINSTEACIMVATKAFGMGINKNDVSLVVHYDIPLSLEEYYQEAGRAARGKGITGTCILLYNSGSKEEASHGSYEFTKKWVYKQSSLKELETTVLASRLSESSRYQLQYFHIERFMGVMKFINKQLNLPQKESSTYSMDVQKYIIDYLQTALADSTRKYIEAFLFDLDQFLFETNLLHVANSKIANILRWHPEKYELNKKNTVTISEWRRKRGTDFDMFITTDISRPSAFIRIPNLRSQEEPDKEAMREYIGQAWKQREKTKFPKVERLYAVSNDPDLIIMEEYSFKNDKWVESKEEGSEAGDSIILHKSAKRSLTMDKYPEWRTYDPEKYMYDNGEYDFSNAFAYIRGIRQRTVSFSICGLQKLSYFDMCVADVVYSLWHYGRRRIYVKNVWEVLSGNIKAKFSRAGSKIETAIRDSLKKLYNTRISISDPFTYSSINNERFLPFSEPCVKNDNSEPDVNMQFLLTDTPPLYRYCEEVNGEIIRIHVSFLQPRKFGDKSLYGIKPLIKAMTVFSIDLKRIYYVDKNDNSVSPTGNDKIKSALVPVILLDDSIRRKQKNKKKNQTSESNNKEAQAIEDNFTPEPSNKEEQATEDNQDNIPETNYVTFKNFETMVPEKIVDCDNTEYSIYIKDYKKYDKDHIIQNESEVSLKQSVRGVAIEMIEDSNVKNLTITEPDKDEEITDQDEAMSTESGELDFVTFKDRKTKPVLNLMSNENYSIVIIRYTHKEKSLEKIVEQIYTISGKTITWRSTIEDSVLLHYLLHRISIFNARKRGDYIRFSTIMDMLDDYIPESDRSKKGKNLLYRKILAYLCYFQRISYIRFYAYARELNLVFEDEKREKGTAYYKVTHWPSVRYWRDGDRGMIQFTDILLKWVRKPEGLVKETDNNKHKYTKDTITQLRNLEIDDLEGIMMLNKKDQE